MPKIPPYRAGAFLFAPVSYELPAIQIRGGTFYKQYATPGAQQQPLFKDLDLTIGHPALERWAVIGPAGAGKTTLLELLRGLHVCEPSSAQLYPAILAAAEVRGMTGEPQSLIQYLPATGREGMLAGAAAQGAYLSARYESGREPTDLTVSDYLTGNLYQNPDPNELARVQDYARGPFYKTLLKKLHLTKLANQPLSTLSNGQTRRARIARALVPRPAMLILDEPFLGLDPMAQMSLEKLFTPLSTENFLSLICAFEDDQDVPAFITHVIYLNSHHQIVASGPRSKVHATARTQGYRPYALAKSKCRDKGRPREYLENARTLRLWSSQTDAPAAKADADRAEENRPTVIEMSGVRVQYGETVALGSWGQDIGGEKRSGLWWRVRQGERWGVFGPNGSGKTTLLSLINSDHPQAYGQPVKVFGRGRLPEAGQPGLSVFELQARIGQASPEIHNFFPRDLTIRQTLESAWAETFRARPQLTHEADIAIEATLRWFQPLLDPACASDIAGAIAQHFGERSKAYPSTVRAYRDSNLDWADSVHFRDLDFATQRVVLFLRAVVRKPELLVLDEAFGGMSQTARIRCMMWLAYGERQFAAPTPGNTRMQKRTSALDLSDSVLVEGLEPRQTLLCVAHRRDDVPPLLNRWVLLPPDGGRADGQPPRFGNWQFVGDEWKVGYWWDDMWWGGSRQS